MVRFKTSTQMQKSIGRSPPGSREAFTVASKAGSTSVWKLHHRKLVWHRLYQDKEAALEAVGLSEQDAPH
jgi:hypothetical protein